MTQKTWLITGCSSGFGSCLTQQVMAKDDRVIATFRSQAQVNDFRTRHGDHYAVKLDVTNSENIKTAVADALSHAPIDVLVNNAGYGLFGAVEETSLKEARAQVETNFFGALAMTQALLPHMRARKTGHIVQISSVAGFCSLPGLGVYNASKYALEGFSEALAIEVAPLGIRVTLVEPGPFRTEWAGGSSKDVAQKIPDYAATAHKTADMIHGYSGNQPGDPVKGAALIIDAVHSQNPPLRLPLGQMAIDRMRAKMQQVEKDIQAWEKASIATTF